MTDSKALTPHPSTGRPREWTDERIEVETKALYEWIENTDNYFFTSFLNQRRLNPQQIDRFCKYYPPFRIAFELAKQFQEQRLVELAVTRKGDPGFIKFILQNKAGWKDKTELSGDQANPLSFVLDRIAQKAREPIEIEVTEGEV